MRFVLGLLIGLAAGYAVAQYLSRRGEQERYWSH
jgi:hypothetical protein